MEPTNSRSFGNELLIYNAYISRCFHFGLLLLLIMCFSTLSHADVGTHQANSDFDHLSTGFFLSPAHQNVECSDCHVRGVFKGTPTACDGCHNSSTVITALGKNPGHINSTGDCEECHGENGLNWTEINFKTHDAVMGDCASCHNDSIAVGKSKQHIPSDDECDVCHLSTSTYLIGVFDHSGTTVNCHSCHDGNHSGTPTASARHMQSTTTCESCHNALTKDWYSIIGVDHSDVILGTCDDCHSVSNAVGPVKSNQHIPSHDECDLCHNTISFIGGTFDHSSTLTNCSGCHDGNHDGASYYGRRHINSSQTCESCHNATTKDWFSIVNVDHSDVFVGTCDDCHSARNGIGPIKSVQHIPSNNECDDCHNTNVFSGGTFDHSGTNSNCSSCHDGNHDGASYYGRRHMQSTETCESCHNALTKDWYSIIGVDHSDIIAGTCSECHAGRNAFGTTQANDHINSSNTCDNCHFQAGVTWLGAVDQEAAQLNVLVQAVQAPLLVAEAASDEKQSVESERLSFVHPDVTENCLSCHDGSVAMAKKVNHLSTADSCESCHQIGSWSPVNQFDHNAAQGSCSTCHNNAVATGQPVNHINTLKVCDDCHRGDSWTPVIRVDHASTLGNCFSCHNRKTAEGKPINHISSDNNCDNCHVTHIWSQVVMDHSNVTGSCALCHNGRSAPAKPVNHLASNNTCNDCHRRRAWTPVYRVDHLAVIGSCSSCHNGRMAGGKSANHPSTPNNCEDCHRSNLWSHVTFNHNNVSGTCLSCHSGDYKQQYHKKTQQGAVIYYSANELVDCAGSCHIYQDQTFSTISIRKPGPDHRPRRGAW